MERQRGRLGLTTRVVGLAVGGAGVYLFLLMRWHSTAQAAGWTVFWWMLALAGLAVLWAGVLRWQVIGPILDLSSRPDEKRSPRARASARELPLELEVLEESLTGALEKARVSAQGEEGLRLLLVRLREHSEILRDKAGRETTSLEDGVSRARDLEEVLRQVEEGIAAMAGRSEALDKEAQSLVRLLAEGQRISRKASAEAEGLLQQNRDLLDALEEMDSEARAFERSSQSAASLAARVQELAAGVAGTARELERSTAGVYKEGTEGGQTVRRVDTQARETSRAVTETATIVRDLGSRSEEIGAVVEVIESIADETNLLALNAAIIAAQAGEHGRSFAVVAEEIRELAERTSSSTKEVAELVKGIQDGIGQASKSIHESSDLVSQSVTLAEEAGAVWESVRGGAERNLKLVEGIVQTCSEQCRGADGLAQAVGGLIASVDGVGKRARAQRGVGERASKGLEELHQLAEEWSSLAPAALEAGRRVSENAEPSVTGLRKDGEGCGRARGLACRLRACLEEAREAVRQREDILDKERTMLDVAEKARSRSGALERNAALAFPEVNL